MDEQNESVGASHIVPDDSSDGATNGHSDFPTSSSQVRRELIPIARTGEQALADAPTELPLKTTTTSGKLVAQNYALRRTRINRIIIRKHRHERLSRNDDASPRLLITALIVAGVLFSLFTSSIGAALAYYQVNSPMLSDVANHSLFQSTRIYDRN